MPARHPIIELPNPTGKLLGELELPAAPESVRRARRFVASSTAAFDVPEAGEDAEILVSELVTNAVRHAEARLRVRLIRVGPRLRIEVHDPSPLPPRRRCVDLLEETGRGWFLVAALADRHGTEPTDDGKVVWCELSAWATDL